MTYLRAGIKPDWTRKADRITDMSDAWMEMMDPENERGEVCMAFLEAVDVPCYNAREGCFDAPGFRLIGISIEDTTGKIYRDRDWCHKILGADVIWRVEASEMETAA